MEFVGCAVCLQEFSHKQDNHIPMVGFCGHSVCAGCCKAPGFSKDCPKCRCADSFSDRVVNYQCVDLLSNLQELQYKFQNKEEEINNLQSTVAAITAEKDVLKRKIEAEEERERISLRCKECNFTLPIEKAHICLTCNFGTKEFDLHFDIVDYDKTEQELICGFCVLHVHNEHNVLKYLPIKLAQVSETSLKHYNSLLIESRGENWEKICSDITQMENNIRILVKEIMTSMSSSKTWTAFEQDREIIDELMSQAVSANDIITKAVLLYKEEYEEIATKLKSLLP